MVLRVTQCFEIKYAILSNHKWWERSYGYEIIQKRKALAAPTKMNEQNLKRALK